ncbi:TPA_asm: DUF4176 domain-containing protein [Listeria monocytogenes]|nr:DUF4176 domain-containing protein [Listeria monocytogenes]
MERQDILPIGTVLYINESLKKVMIIGRKLMKEKNGKNYYFDYTGCLFPEGIVGEEVLFFNEDDISDVVHLGLIDADEKEVVKRLKDWEMSTTVIQATKETFKDGREE